MKTAKLTPEAAGQINMYLNYYASEVNDADDNSPIGIILCTNKEQLIAQVEAVLKKWYSEDKPE